MTKKEHEGEEFWKDMLRRDREAHERLLQRVANRRAGKWRPPDAKPLTSGMEQPVRLLPKIR
jgi:hypothetical protein